MTIATATIFMLTSLTLSILSIKRSVVSSIVDEHPAGRRAGAPPTAETSAAPANPAAPAAPAKP
jgi:preprotein translocase subunit SecG